jgi:peptide/nickel transport system permease protein
MLVSDWIVYILLFLCLGIFIYLSRYPHFYEPWERTLTSRTGMVAAVILVFYAVVGLMDSIHFKVSYPALSYSVPQVKSLLDITLASISDRDERSYSAPFATQVYSQAVFQSSKDAGNDYTRLNYAGAHLEHPEKENQDIFIRVGYGFLQGIFTFAVIFLFVNWVLSHRWNKPYGQTIKTVLQGKTYIAWREILITFGVMWILCWILLHIMFLYHVLGTDKIGRDVLYASIKSIRTGLFIGTLTTIFMLPFALILGMMAGFFGGWIDDIIQYLYTTLSSIPGVLLISATILVMQVYIAAHPHLFTTLAARADARLLALCLILGITSWASLCRLLRAETLKLRELEFVQASRALGARRMRIIFRHIMPNVLNIVFITLVLDFSTLVLAEAILSYVGVGVDPTTYSWGNIINSSRLELAREPIVWWPLMGALVFMFVLVLCANLFADAVRDAFDPRIRIVSE